MQCAVDTPTAWKFMKMSLRVWSAFQDGNFSQFPMTLDMMIHTYYIQDIYIYTRIIYKILLATSSAHRSTINLSPHSNACSAKSLYRLQKSCTPCYLLIEFSWMLLKVNTWPFDWNVFLFNGLIHSCRKDYLTVIDRC